MSRLYIEQNYIKKIHIHIIVAYSRRLRDSSSESSCIISIHLHRGIVRAHILETCIYTTRTRRRGDTRRTIHYSSRPRALPAADSARSRQMSTNLKRSTSFPVYYTSLMSARSMTTRPWLGKYHAKSRTRYLYKLTSYFVKIRRVFCHLCLL